MCEQNSEKGSLSLKSLNFEIIEIQSHNKEKFMNFKKLLVLLMLITGTANSVWAQCNVTTGVTLTLVPSAPVTFQSFPVSLLGIGNSNANLSAFENFGLKFNNSNQTATSFSLPINIIYGGTSILKAPVNFSITVPPGESFLGVPQLLSGNFSGKIRVKRVGKSVELSSDFQKKISGGFPSGSFEFQVGSCGSLVVNVLGNTTVELLSPSNGAETSSLPQFTWSGQGGSKFILTIAKLKNKQSKEDGLNTSSQRAVIDVGANQSYQTTAGGPSPALENNLTWNPGLTSGEYACRVVMEITDPTTGTKSIATSGINTFTVGEGSGNTTGLNTKEIINLLQDALKVNMADLLKGYNAYEITINGNNATIDELREKVQNLPDKVKVEIKP